jgi:hypothetical protein
MSESRLWVLRVCFLALLGVDVANVPGVALRAVLDASRESSQTHQSHTGVKMIKPTIGRVVWYHPAFASDSGSNEYTLAALVCHVHSDTSVNLAVFDSNGVAASKTSVFLFQGEGVRPSFPYAEWMPYQIGQAAKTEAVLAGEK